MSAEITYRTAVPNFNINIWKFTKKKYQPTWGNTNYNKNNTDEEMSGKTGDTKWKTAKTNVGYMRIWHYRLRKTKVKMYYTNTKEKHVSGLCGAAVERKTLVFLIRKRNNVQLSSNPYTSL